MDGIEESPQPQSQASSSNVSMSSSTSCCSVAEVKEEIKTLINSFEKDVNKTLEKSFGPSVAPQVSISLWESSKEVAKDKAPKVDLSSLFAEGSFPATGPARRGSVRSGCTRNASTRTNGRRASHHQATGCLNAAASTQPGGSLPQTPEQVVHTHVICDSCEKTIVGVRHKCLDCPDFDLCTPCIEAKAAENHNPFHEFFDIHEPGRVIVHTVFDSDRQPRTTPTVNATAPQPTVHNATCDLCQSAIVGTRYKCCQCPDFDTCEVCFQITPEQHPKHSFFKMEADTIIRRHTVSRKAHFARCDSCSKTIYGVRFKCLHPECPDFDLCDRCEALPIPVHPENHPLLKMRNPDVVIPTVYRVGGSEIIPEPQAISVPKPYFGWDFRPEYAPQDGYNPTYIKSQTCMSVPVATVPISDHEEDRAPTPRPKEKVLVEVDEHEEPQNPFADPPPMIAPIDGVSASMVSSFTATLEDKLNAVNAVVEGSPLSEASDREKSLFEGFLDRPKTTEAEKSFEEQRHADEEQQRSPSFVNDVLEDFFKTLGKPYVRREQPLVKEVEMTEKKPEEGEEALSTIVSGMRNLVAIVTGEDPSISSAAEPEQVQEAQPESEVVQEEKEEKPVVTESKEIPAEEAAPVAVEAKQVEESVKEDLPLPTLSAGYVADVTVPDGQVFPPGAEFMKCWKMVNDGTLDWPESTEVVFVAGQPGLVARGNEVVKVGVVKPGEEVDVWTGELKAPEGIGRYVGYWRLRNGDTKEVFGNSIWVEIEVAEADHLSDETGSMSGSSIVMMPDVLGTAATATASSATSVRPESLTLTIPSSASTTTDGDSELGSEGSLIDYMSEGEEVAWEDARSRLDSASAAPSQAALAAPGSPLGDEFELVYDSSSDM